MSDRRKPFTATDLGKRVFSARRASKLSRDALARLALCSPLTVYNVETGRHPPNSLTLRALAVALRVSADTLLGLVQDRQDAPGSR